MAKTTEIAPNIYRISIYAQSGDLQFNHFLVKANEPLLFHTGLRGMHAEIREAVSKLINVSDLRHISFSHFESDECGGLNEWLGVAPKADVICGQGQRAGLCERLHWPRSSRACRRRIVFDGQAPLPLLPDAPSAARLGRRRAF